MNKECVHIQTTTPAFSTCTKVTFSTWTVLTRYSTHPICSSGHNLSHHASRTYFWFLAKKGVICLWCRPLRQRSSSNSSSSSSLQTLPPPPPGLPPPPPRRPWTTMEVRSYYGRAKVKWRFVLGCLFGWSKQSCLVTYLVELVHWRLNTCVYFFNLYYLDKKNYEWLVFGQAGRWIMSRPFSCVCVHCWFFG